VNQELDEAIRAAEADPENPALADRAFDLARRAGWTPKNLAVVLRRCHQLPGLTDFLDLLRRRGVVLHVFDIYRPGESGRLVMKRYAQWHGRELRTTERRQRKISIAKAAKIAQLPQKTLKKWKEKARLRKAPSAAMRVDLYLILRERRNLEAAAKRRIMES